MWKREGGGGDIYTQARRQVACKRKQIGEKKIIPSQACFLLHPECFLLIIHTEMPKRMNNSMP